MLLLEENLNKNEGGNKMKKKALFGILLSSAVVISLPVHAVSIIVTDDEVLPSYTIACDVRSNLSINGNTALCHSSARSGTATKISAVQTLQKNDILFFWHDYDNSHWETISNCNLLNMYNTKSITKGTYRLKTEFTLTSPNENAENITVFSKPKTLNN